MVRPRHTRPCKSHQSITAAHLCIWVCCVSCVSGVVTLEGPEGEVEEGEEETQREMDWSSMQQVRICQGPSFAEVGQGGGRDMALFMPRLT